MLAGSFTADIAAIRERARQRMEEGPLTGSCGKDPKGVIAVLNDDVVATGIVCRIRYTRHAISAAGINRAQVAGEFTGHAESYETCRDEDLEGMLRGNLVDLLGA